MYQKKSITLRSIGLTIVFTLVFMSVPLHAAVLYVSTGGTRTSGASTEGNWSNSNCYGTISAAIQRMSGGDEVVVDDGTYTGVNNVIGRYNSFNVPSGTSSRYTVIRARNPFQVTIDSGQSSAWDYYGMMIYISSGSSYIQVDGFKGINRDGSNNTFVGILGSHVKITRCMFKTQGSANNENCVVSVTGSASHVLIEDCALTGGYRYGFIVRGVSSDPHNIIFRRCVARGDWVQSSEPNSIFAVYGHNSSAASGPYNIMFQNCIAINQNASVPDADWKPYGPWYIFKGNHDITLNGCITLDNDQTGSTSGSWIRNDYGGENIDVVNSVFWGFRGIGTVFAGDVVDVRNCTFGGNTTSYSLVNYASPSSFKNNLVIRSAKGTLYGSAFSTASYNSFDSGAFGSNVVAYKNDLLHLPRVESTSNRINAGEGGGKVGAHIMYRMGRSGTLWDESGWNTQTSEPLWPWPNEDKIREWFRASNNPPAGASPSSNNTARGFCADGQTLTKYIWEYLGRTIPSDIYSGDPGDPVDPVDPGDPGDDPDDPDTIPPAKPTGVAVKQQ